MYFNLGLLWIEIIKGILIVFIILALLSSSGCVKRNLHVRSDPPGATVYFNEKELGKTPLDFDFMWYAVHKVELKMEGYEPIEVLENLKSPIFFWMPLDFILELIPHDFWDRKELSYTLTPKEE